VIAHLRKWFREYIVATVSLFPVVWLATPQLQTLLPPKAVSVLASIAGGILLAKSLIAARKAQQP
jgi:hypothetical protein